jgi:acylphosphatase
MARTRRKVVVHGAVQGVNFRDSVRRRAESRGISGWVCNRADGAVEAVFEGDPDAVESLVEFARSGPPSAEVVQVDVDEEQPAGLSGFDVR